MSKMLPIGLVVLLALGWMGLSSNQSGMTPGFIGVSSAQTESTGDYFPAGFVIQPNESEREVHEYY